MACFQTYLTQHRQVAYAIDLIPIMGVAFGHLRGANPNSSGTQSVLSSIAKNSNLDTLSGTAEGGESSL